MRLLARALLGVASLLAATCSGNTEPDATITAVSPAAAYNKDEVTLAVSGGPFRPVYDIETGSGRATTQLGAFTGFLTPRSSGGAQVALQSLRWVSSTELEAVVPPGVPRGVYDFEVRDPRGRLSRLEGGYESLGLDTTKPVVTIFQPTDGTIVIAGAEVPVALRASDAPGRLTMVVWTVSSGANTMTGLCPLGLVGEDVTCRFVFTAPRPAQSGQPLNVNITATDSAGLPGEAVTTLSLGMTPTVTTFSPAEGASAGGTEIVVEGSDFIAGMQVLVDGVPAKPSGDADAHSLRVLAPPHEPGIVNVSVRAGSVELRVPGSYQYVGRPIVRAVSPVQGPVTGGTPVVIVGKYFREGVTRIAFGTSDGSTEAPLVCPVFVSPNRIEGFAPPGLGALSIYARDPVGGDDQLPLAFTYLDDDSPDAAAPLVPPPCQRPNGAPP